MRKIIFFIAFSFVLSVSAFGQSFDFASSGERESNEILKEFANDIIDNFHGDVTSYYYDIDNDGNKEIIGIVKSNIFYNLEGYRLVILKKQDDEWMILENNINFDETKPFDITGNKITYYKSVFYNSRRATATVQNGNIKTAGAYKDYFAKRRTKGIEEATRLTEGQPKIEVNIEEFPVCAQRAVKIDYKDLSERTKHYIEIK